MSYYGAKGDFYSGRTGYYRGDPGFFSNVLGAIGGAVKGYVTSGGSLVSAGAGAVRGFVKQHPVISAAGAAGSAFAGEQIVTHLPGRQPIATRTGGGRTVPGAMGTPATRGLLIHPRGMRVGGRRRRRMNVCNVRALRRASRRAHGFLKISRKLVSYYQPKHPKGRAYIRAKRHRR